MLGFGSRSNVADVDSSLPYCLGIVSNRMLSVAINLRTDESKVLYSCNVAIHFRQLSRMVSPISACTDLARRAATRHVAEL